MNIVWVFSSGFAIGIMIGSLTGRLVLRRAARRLAYHLELEATAGDLERRREARDSGRATAVRRDAGKTGDQSNLFAVRPGKLQLNRNQEKLAKGLADHQDSGRLDELGSNPTDNPII